MVGVLINFVGVLIGDPLDFFGVLVYLNTVFTGDHLSLACSWDGGVLRDDPLDLSGVLTGDLLDLVDILS